MVRLLALALTAGGLIALPASADALGTVHPPTPPGTAHSALLVLLPDAGRTAADYAGAARAAQAAAGTTRLWVAVAEAGAPGADALVKYETLNAQVRAAGFTRLQDKHVVVAGFGAGARGLPLIAKRHQVGGSAAIGTNETVDAGVLRVVGELDRRTRVGQAALSAKPVLVLPATTNDQLQGQGTGAVLGDLVEAAVRRDPADLRARLKADRVVGAFRKAAAREQGATCAKLQHHTADLAPEDAARLSVRNRVSADLIAPTPEGVAASDFGGFLYDKAELATADGRAQVTTNSYRVPAVGVASGATEVMCKTKSRSAVAQALYADFNRVDASAPSCAGYTEATLAWARAQVSPAAAARFGGVTVLPDMAKSAGPEWVFSPLLLRPADPVTGRWEVQSPSLVTQLSDTELDPEFAGNHYCKVLSPVRALELVLDDAVPVT
jgi:hypothetical protein